MSKHTTIPMVSLAVLLVAGMATGGAPSVKDILAKSDKAGATQSSKLYITQTVFTPSGDKRSFKMVSYSKDGTDKGLTEYLSPSQVRGMKILTLNDGDDIWSYFPRTNRTRKIASSARNRKVQGSDFTYDDMASGKMAESWQGKVAGSEQINGVECHKLYLTPTAKGPKSYKKAVAWVSKKDSTAHRILYFDDYGDKLKQLEITNYKKISGVQIPFQYTMTNLQDGGRTIMKVAKAEVNIKLDDALFTEAGLSK